MGTKNERIGWNDRLEDNNQIDDERIFLKAENVEKSRRHMGRGEKI